MFSPSFPVADWHLHASFYRTVGPKASGRIEPMIEEGVRLGLEMMGIGEHLNDKPKHPVSCFLDLARDLAKAQSPIPVYLGTEVDILDAHGRLSLPEGLRERTGLDYVIASVHCMGEHDGLDSYLDSYHRLMMGAAGADNGADIIGHPWHNARSLVDRGMVREWRFEMVPHRFNEELLDALAGRRKAVEINCRSLEDFKDAAYREFVARARERGVLAAAGSDAHSVEGMAVSVEINRFLAEMGFGADEVWIPRRARNAPGGAVRGGRAESRP